MYMSQYQCVLILLPVESSVVSPSSGFDEGRSYPIPSSAVSKGKSVSAECTGEGDDLALTAASGLVAGRDCMLLL